MSGITGLSTLMKELKLSYKEDEKIYRQQANSFYDDKIAEMQKQVDLLHKQADKIGKNAWMNFAMSVVTTVISTVGSILGSVGDMAKSITQQIAGTVLGGIAKGLGSLQGLINGLNDKSLKEIEVKEKASEQKAQTFEKFYQDLQEQEKEAKRLGDSAMQDMKEAIRNTVGGQESMAKI